MLYFVIMASLLLDSLLVVFVLTQAAMGIRRGFVLGMLELLGWLVSLALALILVTPLTSAIEQATRLPQGIIGLVSSFVVLCVSLILLTALAQKLYRDVLAPHLRGNIKRADHLLGAVPGAVTGLVIAGLLLEMVMLAPVNMAVGETIMSTRLAKPTALAMLEAGKPFVVIAQDAALDVNGLLAKRPGEPALRFAMPVTDMSADADAEKQLLDLLNAERAKRGLQPLVADAKLTQVARQHSEEMLKLHYFAHESQATGSPFDRMGRAGIRYRVAGENLAFAPNPERAHTGLMNSPEHRANILRPEFRKVGIGVINGGLSGLMVTQNFTD